MILRKRHGLISKPLKIDIFFDPEILLLETYLKENVEDTEKDSSIRIFMAKFFVVEKNQNNLNAPKRKMCT